MEQTEEELLEYARMHYPIGTQYVPAHVDKGVNEVTDAYYNYSKHKNEYIHVSSKHINLDYNNCIYADGKWATIVNQIDPMVEIQRQAKEKFPIGSTFNNTEGNRHVLLETDETYKINGTSIWAHCGAGCLYQNGKWATLVEPDYKALQNKAWEVFKDVKKGDKYISTRGNEFTATKTPFKSEGSIEENCYIDCGSGFLWEIKDGKELYGTLLPKEEEKWIPKVGDWIVSLEDMIFNRTKGDVFQVLEVFGNSIYYKKGVKGDISTFRPAEPHEIPVKIISTHTGSIISHVTTDLSIPKHLLEYKDTPVKPKFNSEEIKIKVKKSKTIKI
jgi:hypothetical protein